MPNHMLTVYITNHYIVVVFNDSFCPVTIEEALPSSSSHYPTRDRRSMMGMGSLQIMHSVTEIVDHTD